MAREGRPVVFVDRDGTVIREREYLSDPGAVELLPGAVEGLRVFQDAGRLVVIVTNQSGIARGLFGPAEYEAVQQEVLRQLSAAGVDVLASYHCPHHPAFTGPCECRKPAAGLFRRASEEHGLALAGSVLVGDRIRDVVPALDFGGTGILVRTGYGAAEAEHAPEGLLVAADLAAAADLYLRESQRVDRSGGSS